MQVILVDVGDDDDGDDDEENGVNVDVDVVVFDTMEVTAAIATEMLMTTVMNKNIVV
jgi:hypothetical protein